MKHALATTAPGRMAGITLLIFLLGQSVPQANAQAWHSGKVNPNMTVYSTLDGSFGNSSSVVEMSNDVGFNFTPLLGMDALIPIYFVVPTAQKPHSLRPPRALGISL